MRPRTWFVFTLGVLAAGAILISALNIWVVDFYGLGRNDRGRSLPTLGDTRVAKYLLAFRYVPANFDGLLLGPSITANWRPSLISGFHFYNASLNGGNIVEIKAVADQAIASGKMRAAVLLIHPSMTLSHDFKTIELTPELRYSALGSESLLDAYKDEFSRIQHPNQLITDSAGTEFYGDEPHPLNAMNVELLKPETPFYIDETALKAYSDFAHHLHQQHIKTLLVVPPLAEELYQRKPHQFSEYTRLILTKVPDSFSVLDFTGPEFISFRQDSSNFTDGVHLTSTGADRATHIVNEWLNKVALGGTQAVGLSTANQPDRALPVQ